MSQDLVSEPESNLKSLQNKGFLSDKKLTQKGLALLDESNKIFVSTKKTKQLVTTEFMENLTEYREIFPNRKLPSGKAARTNMDDLKKKMIEFMSKYPQYDWDTILDATTYYVETYRKEDFKFMKTAAYYISKNGESDLATDCELLLEGGHEELQKKTSLYSVR